MKRKLVAVVFILLNVFGCAVAQGLQSRPETSSIFVTVTPSPTPPPEDLTPYRQVMRPAYASEVDQQAAAGITRYKIEAALRPESLTDPNGPQITGRMRVKYTNTETVLLNQVYFRLLPNTPAYGGEMTVTQIEVNGQAVQPALLAQNSTLEVPLFQALAPGEGVEITLAYQAAVPATADYGYGMYAYQDNILTLAGFYPLIPVFDNQGWHIEILPLHGDATYTDVAFYDVTFTAPADMVIVTSGDILTNTIHADGQQTIHAYSGPMRDFFVALSADYQSLNQEVDGIIVTSYFPAGYEEGGRMALQVAGQALDIFDNLFGPYPYRAFDIAVSPMPAALGGLEFPGVIVMAQRYYNRPNAAFEFVLAHEVSHQWWYGLVGNDQANYPWLDEALTQYSAVNYFEQRHGPHKRPELVDQNFWFPYNQLLATNADRPVAGPVADFSETMYSSVVYGKGPLFFEHLRDHLGDPRYFAGLRTYAKTHRYGVAAPDDLLAAFNQAGGQDVTWLYRQWILGE